VSRDLLEDFRDSANPVSDDLADEFRTELNDACSEENAKNGGITPLLRLFAEKIYLDTYPKYAP
jgi:hypothetical protein